MATLQIKKVRALELARFLKGVTPNMFSPKSDFFLSQKCRVTVEQSIQDFKKKFDDYIAKSAEEAKPYQEELKAYQETDPKPTPEQTKVKEAEVNTAFTALMKPFKDEIDALELNEGQNLVAIDVDDKNLEAVKEVFTSEGENAYTLILPTGQRQFLNDQYMETATALGLTS